MCKDMKNLELKQEAQGLLTGQTHLNLLGF
jgi:hypothetical protein